MRPQTAQRNPQRQMAANALRVAQKKKIATAAVLLVVMAVLWIRNFAGEKSPAIIAASASFNGQTEVQQAEQKKIIYIDLPFDPQRHNNLANDFFDAKSFKAFGAEGQTENGSSGLQGGSLLAAAADAVELVAIVNGKHPQAFIADKLLEKGQSFKFEFHGKIYEWTIADISENKVELLCEGQTIIKKIPNSISEPQ